MLNKELVECDDVAATRSASKNRHDSARTPIYGHVTFISLAGIIRVSIGKLKTSLLMRGSKSVGRKKFSAIKARCS